MIPIGVETNLVAAEAVTPGPSSIRSSSRRSIRPRVFSIRDFFVVVGPDCSRRLALDLGGQRCIIFGARLVGAYWKIDWPKLGHSARRMLRRILVLKSRASAQGASAFRRPAKNGLEVFDHLAAVPRSGVIQAEHDPANLQLAIDPLRDQIDRLRAASRAHATPGNGPAAGSIPRWPHKGH